MKCDELNAYKGDVTIPVYGSIADAKVYLKKDVDAAIEELKEFAEDACLERDDNQTAIDELQAENAELKQKLAEKESWVKMLGEGEATLSLELEKTKQKLENVQASMYADVVDANMENRILRRALWLARANHADTMQKYNIECKCDGWVHRVNKWVDVERKCLKKAEEYK